MHIDRTYEIPTGRNVLYLNDHHLSIPIQIAIACELRRLYVEEKVAVMAFEQSYGRLPNYVQEGYEEFKTLEPAIFLYQSQRASANAGAIHLLQVYLQQELVEGRVQMWGMEDDLLFCLSGQVNDRYIDLIENGNESPREKGLIPESVLQEWQQKKVQLERQIHELTKLRDSAIVQNIETFMAERNLPRLPLVQGYGHFESIREKLGQRGIGTVSYLFEG